MRIFVVHGIASGVDRNWFPWLSQQLSEYNYEVNILQLPSPNFPDRNEWIQVLNNEIGIPDQETIIIGHSLGVYTVLWYLTHLKVDWSLNGLVLVAGCRGKIDSLPQLDDFVGEELDLTSLSQRVTSITMIHSDNDPYVFPSASRDLAKELDASIIEIPGGGHFTGDEGWRSFPEVLTTVLSATANTQ